MQGKSVVQLHASECSLALLSSLQLQLLLPLSKITKSFLKREKRILDITGEVMAADEAMAATAMVVEVDMEAMEGMEAEDMVVVVGDTTAKEKLDTVDMVEAMAEEEAMEQATLL